MEEEKFNWLKLSDDLLSLLNDKMSEDEILNKYEHAHRLGKNIDYVLCNLSHFLSDRDIRERDVKYKYMQEQEMRKLIDLIRQGNIKKAKEIDFLHDSGEV